MAKFGSRTKTSDYKGVSLHKRSGKWQATIFYNQKLHYLGSFDREEDAAHVYDAKAKEQWGPDVDVNFPIRRRTLDCYQGDPIREAVEALRNALQVDETDKTRILKAILSEVDPILAVPHP